jgi:HSP20 family protein
MNQSSHSSRDRFFRNWIPTSSFNAFRQEMTDMMDSFLNETVPHIRGDHFPRVDVAETADAVEVIADLPGFQASEITVELTEHEIVLAGQHVSSQAENTVQKQFHRVERRLTEFHRSIPLPCPVDESQVQANVQDGVLTVLLPKRADAKRHIVPVQPMKTDSSVNVGQGNTGGF